MGNMKYIEVTTEEAIKLLQSSKGKKVMVAITELETVKNIDSQFYPRLKLDCETMIKDAETIASYCDDFVKQLKVFTEIQPDIMNLKPKGIQNIILLR